MRTEEQARPNCQLIEQPDQNQPPESRDKPARIVLLHSQAVGDAFARTPTIRALRRSYPQAHITMVCDNYCGRVFQHSPDLDEVITLQRVQFIRPKDAARLCRLRRTGVDLLIDLLSGPRSFPWVILVGGRRRIGFKSRRSGVYTDVVPRPGFMHEALRQAQILSPLGIELTEVDKQWRFQVIDADRTDAQRILREAGLHDEDRFVILQVTTGRNRPPFQEWPVEKFASLADRLWNVLKLRVVVGSATTNPPVLQQLASLTQNPIISVAGRTTMGVMGAIIEKASAYVGYNTGTMHLASAVRVPVVAFSPLPWDRVLWTPWTTSPCRLLGGGPDCIGCLRCASDHDKASVSACLRNLDVDEVFEAVTEILTLQQCKQGAGDRFLGLEELPGP